MPIGKRRDPVKRRLMVILPLMWPAAATAQPLGQMPTLHTPDIIAPAVLPYLACLYAERGLPLLRATNGAQIAFDKSSGDCSAARTQAKADAARLLAGKAAPGAKSNDEFIEETLADMDQYVAALPVAQGAQAKGQVIGIPVTIEDEVQPAYRRYDECLKTQASGTPVTSATTMAVFRSAMKICASVRDYAVTDAARALSAKGWDEARRRQAAESTFAKVDDSWLAMGRQYEQLLAEREAAYRAKEQPPAKRP